MLGTGAMGLGWCPGLSQAKHPTGLSRLTAILTLEEEVFPSDYKTSAGSLPTRVMPSAAAATPRARPTSAPWPHERGGGKHKAPWGDRFSPKRSRKELTSCSNRPDSLL